MDNSKKRQSNSREVATINVKYLLACGDLSFELGGGNKIVIDGGTVML